MKINVVIEKDEYGYYAYCPELKGCHTQGDTFEEITENIREAILLYLETMDESERQSLLSKDIYMTSLEVSCA